MMFTNYESYYDESIRRLDKRSGKHIDVSPFNRRKSNNHITVMLVIIDSTVIFSPF